MPVPFPETPLPFTPAHTVAILPLRRVLGRRTIVSALAVGSVVPDFHYFFPLGPSRFDSHSLSGLVVFCLPVGVLAWLIWHLLAAPLVQALAPGFVRRRLDPAAFAGRLPAGGPLAVGLAILIGALTHLAWDAFTHPGRATAWWPALSTPLASAGGYTLHVYGVLQHVSTLLGFAVLARVWARRPSHVNAAPPVAARSPWLRVALAVLLVVPATLIGARAGFAHAAAAPGPLHAVRLFLWFGIGAGARTGALAILVLGLLWRWRTASRGADVPTISEGRARL